MAESKAATTEEGYKLKKNKQCIVVQQKDSSLLNAHSITIISLFKCKQRKYGEKKKRSEKATDNKYIMQYLKNEVITVRINFFEFGAPSIPPTASSQQDATLIT